MGIWNPIERDPARKFQLSKLRKKKKKKEEKIENQ